MRKKGIQNVDTKSPDFGQSDCDCTDSDGKEEEE
jgi:hypothetical protein